MINLQVIGNLGRDASVRHNNGDNAISFSVAHSESYKDDQGMKHEKTVWVSCTKWVTAGKDGVAPYLTKGTKVYVEGEPSVRTYKNKEGITQASLELRVTKLELLGGSQRQEAQTTTEPAPDQEHSAEGQEQGTSPDDLPF